jgi:hypothetical protein
MHHMRHPSENVRDDIIVTVHKIQPENASQLYLTNETAEISVVTTAMMTIAMKTRRFLRLDLSQSQQ